MSENHSKVDKTEHTEHLKPVEEGQMPTVEGVASTAKAIAENLMGLSDTTNKADTASEIQEASSGSPKHEEKTPAPPAGTSNQPIDGTMRSALLSTVMDSGFNASMAQDINDAKHNPVANPSGPQVGELVADAVIQLEVMKEKAKEAIGDLTNAIKVKISSATAASDASSDVHAPDPNENAGLAGVSDLDPISPGLASQMTQDAENEKKDGDA